MNLDLAVFKWLNSWAGISPFFDWAIRFRAVYLWCVVLVVLALFVLATFFPKFKEYRKKNLELFTWALVSAFGARFVITELIRFFYNRPRPFEILEGVRQLVEHSGGGAFPSGHASLAFALATTVSFYYPKTSILFFLAALSIGVGRVAAGVHWPSDILGGAAVGILTSLLVNFIIKKLKGPEPRGAEYLK
jgi:undecaprenyl-diphosphatase